MSSHQAERHVAKSPESGDSNGSGTPSAHEETPAVVTRKIDSPLCTPMSAPSASAATETPTSGGTSAAVLVEVPTEKKAPDPKVAAPATAVPAPEITPSAHDRVTTTPAGGLMSKTPSDSAIPMRSVPGHL